MAALKQLLLPTPRRALLSRWRDLNAVSWRASRHLDLHGECCAWLGARTASSSSFAAPPKQRWQSPRQAWQPASAGFTAPQPRTSRSRKEIQRRQRQNGGSAAATLKPVRLEVSPKRKRRTGSRAKKHKHSTDLEDLNMQGEEISRSIGQAREESDASMLVPRFRNPQVRRLVQRPVAALPRTPQFFVRFGPPMTAEDLTHDAPSVLVESRRLIDDVLERRQNVQSAPDYVAPDTPFWRVPPKIRNKKPAKWQASREADEDGWQDDPSPPRDASEAAERLQGIVDIRRAPGGWRSETLSPAKAASSLLDEDQGSIEQGSLSNSGLGSTSVADGQIEGIEAAASTPRAEPSAGSASQAGPRSPKQRSVGAGEGLIAALRQQAQEYEQTGVNPDISQSLSEALKHHPGTERAARLREMQACDKDFEALVMEGKASVANFNELIRAHGLQGNLEEALRTHDAMKVHGFEPDADTFVSLLIGASHHRDAELARRLFLKMREQLISATPKVYATLIQAHVRAGDVASGYSLLRKMEDERVQPDVVVHTVLINGLVSEGQLEKAWEEFHSIRTWKLIQPDEVLFTVMIKACAMNLEAERALNLLDDLRTCGLYPTDITYGELIHAMSTTADHARKAFDFYRQMQAEDLPLSPFVFEKLLQACRNLGDAKRAKTTVQEMNEYGLDLDPEMYYHLVGLFATAMRRPKVSETEKLQNLRCAWHVVTEARRTCGHRLDWTMMLNEVLGVYVAGGFANFAMEMLPQYQAFGVQPDAETWEHLLRMLGEDLKDTGRFFTLWDSIPKDPQPPDELYHLALDMALHTRSSQRTCAVLEEMYAVAVFPSPQLTERLAKAGRHVIQIHHLISKFITLNRELKVVAAKRETALLQTHMDEREALLAADGLSVRSPTPQQEERDRHFKKLHQQKAFKRPWLPFGEYLASKQKGGEAYAKRKDRPRPNLLAASSSS